MNKIQLRNQLIVLGCLAIIGGGLFALPRFFDVKYEASNAASAVPLYANASYAINGAVSAISSSTLATSTNGVSGTTGTSS